MMLFSFVAKGTSDVTCEDSTLHFKLIGDALSCKNNVQNDNYLCKAGGDLSAYVHKYCHTTCGSEESDM